MIITTPTLSANHRRQRKLNGLAVPLKSAVLPRSDMAGLTLQSSVALATTLNIVTTYFPADLFLVLIG
jgi:hypothetical protein